jgi:hypothetical protein
VICVNRDQYSTANGNSASGGVAIDSSDRIFAAGIGQDGDQVKHWVVRRSTDHGLSWATVDDLTTSDTSYTHISAVAIDGSGRIFVAGSFENHWLVRQSNDHGATWSNADRVLTDLNRIANDVFVDGAGQIYVAGLHQLPAAASVAFLRTSADNGVT